MPSWTQAQIDRYKSLMSQGRDMNWADRIRLCFPRCKLKPPASQKAIRDAETKLGRSLPADLSELFVETNGVYDNRGDWVVYDLKFFVSDTLGLWDINDLYMAPTTMLTFGGPGNGDRYFFPILPNGRYKGEVYLWDHENDSRHWIAQSLRDYLYRTAIRVTEHDVGPVS